MATKTTSMIMKAVRKRKGLNQAQMAILLGIDQGTVSKIESGKMAPSKTLSILLGFVGAKAP